jgi:uncharacterized protein (TIGR02145 family)
MNRTKNTFWILFLLGWGMCLQAQTHRFVTPTGAGATNGLNWENATTLQNALTEAQGSPNTIIHLMVGEYVLPAEISIPAGVTVMGGYKTSSTETDTTMHSYPGYNLNWTNSGLCTILSGNHNHRVATVHGTLKCCVVRDGNTAENGGGALIDGGTVTHCVLIYNKAFNPNETYQAKGGGAYIQNNGKLLNCVVSFNRADNGFGVAGTTGSVTSNTITQNYATNCGTVTDYDGNVYKTVTIGDQCWMRENLRTTHYADGTAIENGYYSNSTPYYNNPYEGVAQAQIYGYLYNRLAAWNSVSGSSGTSSVIQGVCPTDWHLPSDEEFSQMVAFIQLDASNICGGSMNNIAKSLASNENWSSHYGECSVGNDLTANNSTLFNAQPSGMISSYFDYLYQKTSWITATYNSSNQCVIRTLYWDNATLVTETVSNERYHYSVRCVKNNE